MSIFYSNYISLCAKHNKSASKVAEEIGLSRASANGWRNGAIPSEVNLQKIADYFGVTVEYLKGEEQDETFFSLSKYNAFYQRLHKICKNKGITVTKMVKDLGLSSANMSNWKNGRLPKTEIAFKIANYLDISVYELMGEEEQETKNPSTPRDERIDDIYQIVKDLSETDMVALKAFAAGLKANRKSD